MVVACPSGCKQSDLCSTEDKGLFVDVKYFQMSEVYIPNDVKERYLRTLTLKEDTVREQLLQDAQVERKKTQSEVSYCKTRNIRPTLFLPTHEELLFQPVLNSVRLGPYF